MIAKALKQIIGGLNDYLGKIYDPGLPSYVDKYAAMKAVPKIASGDTKKISVVLINIEEDKVFKNHLSALDRPSNTAAIHPLGGLPTMRVNLYLLFAFHPGEDTNTYAESLSLLTHVLKYFKGTSYQEINIPGTVSPATDPKNFNLEINYHNISLEDSNNMWSNLGGEQKPYAMYQIRLMEIETEDDPANRIPVVTANQITSQSI